MQNPKQSKTLHIEMLGDELSVYDWQRQQMHSLNPTAASVFEICDGETSPEQMAAKLDAPQELIWQSLAELDKAKLLEVEEKKAFWQEDISRRQFLKVGAGVAAAAIVSMMLPSPAAAQSAPPPSGSIVRTALVGTTVIGSVRSVALSAPITDAEIAAAAPTQITFAWSSGSAPASLAFIGIYQSDGGLHANAQMTISRGSNSPQTSADANIWTGNRDYTYLSVSTIGPTPWTVGTMTITLS